MEPVQEAFLAAQTKLLQETGTRARFHTLAVSDPAAGVRQIQVIEAGPEQAKPVVMIHGGNSVAAGWEPLLSLLQDDFHLFAPDRPGCGLTSRIDYRGVPFREHAVAFVGAVLDGLKLERASLVGNSMGGYWALLYALAHPERVDRIALVGEAAGSSPRPTFRHSLMRTPGLNRLLYATVLKPDRSKTRRQMQMTVAHTERLSEAFLDLAYAGSVLPGAQLAWLSMLERLWPLGQPPELTYALSPELRQLQRPTLLLWGERDFCPPQWGERLCSHLPLGELKIIPDAGHLAWLDAPQEVAGPLRAFLA